MQRHGDAKIPAQSVACLKHKRLIYLVVVTAVLAFIGMAVGVAVMATKPEPGPPQPAEQTEEPTSPPTTEDHFPTASPTKATTPVPAPTKAPVVGPAIFDAIATEEPSDNPTDALSPTDVPSPFPTINAEVAPEPEPSPAQTTASPTLAPTFEPSPFPTPERVIREREIGCIESNGFIVTDECCQAAGHLPDTCRQGICECTVSNSARTQLCICEEGKCFNGRECQKYSTPEPTPFPTVQSDNNPNCEVDFDTCVECLDSGFCAYSPDTGRYGSCLNSCDDAVADGRCFEKGGDSGICAIIDTEEPTESPTDAPTIFVEPTESPTVFPTITTETPEEDRMTCKPCDRKVEVEVCLRTDDWPEESSLYIENEDGETKLEMGDFRQSRKMICRTKRLCPKKHWLFVEDGNCDGTGNPSGKIIISTRKGEVFEKTLHNFGCTYEKSFDVPDIEPCP